MAEFHLIMKRTHGWTLFCLIAFIITVLNFYSMSIVDPSTTEGLLYMIRYSVRFSLPWFLLAFVASSLRVLFPGFITHWLLSNRRYFGLGFAYGMAWQLLFIIWLMLAQTDFFMEFVSWFQLFEVVVYIFLLLMTLTSFRLFSRHIGRSAWLALHKTGIYLLWFIIAATYVLYSLDFYPAVPASLFTYFMATLFIVAYILRVTAWVTQRARTDVPV